jgi:DNA-binding XRE family transcriptional regulator
MATKVFFIDPLRVQVETSEGDVYILGYSDNMNYQYEQINDGCFTKCVAFIFDKYYSGSEESIWSEILNEMYNRKIRPFTWVICDRDKERIRLGSRIKELRKERGMDAKELAQKIGIDAANLSRIEQGRFSVGIDILNKIAGVMNMSLDFVPNCKEKL